MKRQSSRSRRARRTSKQLSPYHRKMKAGWRPFRYSESYYAWRASIGQAVKKAQRG